MTNLKDLYWLAGILEGEGSFTNESNSPRIQLKMTDRDVVHAARMMINPNAELSVARFDNEYKTAYILIIQGNLAIQWMMTLYPLMYSRRKERIRSIIAKWKTNERRDKGVDTCKHGHRLLREGIDYILSRNSNYSYSKKCRKCARLTNRLYRRRKAG